MDLNNENQTMSDEEYSMSVFTWYGWKFNVLITSLVIFAMVSIVGQSMIIFYIGRHAPKERPINRMILVDQVRGPHVGTFWVHKQFEQ